MSRKIFIFLLCLQIILSVSLFGIQVNALIESEFQIADADLNKDNVINMSDVVLIAKSFNTSMGDKEYKQEYDLNKDQSINMADIIILAKCFNQIISPVTPTPSTGNNSPVGTFTVWPNVINTGETANFYALASYDIDGSIANYSWDFGDGTTATGPNTKHQYSNTGNYAVKLTVTDNSGLSGTFTQTVSVPLNTGGGSVDKSYYGFEDGTVHGFATNNTSSVITNTTTKAYSGNNSMKWDIDSTAAGMYEFRKDMGTSLKPGTKMVYRLWIPSGAPISEIQPYIMPHNSSWSLALWNADWKDYGSVNKDGWTEFTVTLPATTDPTLPCQIGAQIKTNGIGKFTIYVDSIDWPQGAIPPKSCFDYSPDRPNQGQTVNFDAVNSTDVTLKSSDPDGSISSYDWDFGDGEKGTGS
ncbi:MAG: PKD domain-containing protein, partial [Bacillota bacterium]|nr:PKD domain-containing protein [Bacillota bacterium]